MASSADGGVRNRPESSSEEYLRELMVRYQQQADPAAVDELVARLSGPLLRFLSSSYLCRHDSEDLLQECWLRIHRSRRAYSASEPVLPWIYAIARHTRLDAYRRRRRIADSESSLTNIPERFQHSGPPRLPSDDEFSRLVNSLPNGQRTVIVMLKEVGMSLEEVAGATSSSVGSIKQKAHRAYEKLRCLLDKDKEYAAPRRIRLRMSRPVLEALIRNDSL